MNPAEMSQPKAMMQRGTYTVRQGRSDDRQKHGTQPKQRGKADTCSGLIIE